MNSLYTDCVQNADDCDDLDGDLFPGNIEICNGKLDDCDAAEDADGDVPDGVPVEPSRSADVGFGKIIYINTPLEIIMERIDAGQGRGLAVPDNMTVSEVYSERKPLYENFAEYTLDGAKSIEELIILAENIIYE